MNRDYYGGDDPYEAIKVIRAWGLNFALGSVLKYIKRHGSKPGEDAISCLTKARDYLDDEINALTAANTPTPATTPEPETSPAEVPSRAPQPGLRVGARVRVRETCDFRTCEEGEIVSKASSDKFDWDVHLDGYMLPGEFHADELEVIE